MTKPWLATLNTHQDWRFKKERKDLDEAHLPTKDIHGEGVADSSNLKIKVKDWWHGMAV